MTSDWNEPAARLAAIVASSDDAIVSKDLNGYVTSWNRSAERLFGYTADEMIGSHITRIIPRELYPEEDFVLGRIRSGMAVDHFETIRQRKDGSIVEVSLTVSPVRAPDGRIVGASKIARDISQRKRMERDALRLAAIVESSEDAIISKDLNGIVQTWNTGAGRMFGYSAEEVVGRPITLIVPEDKLGEEEAVLAQIRTGTSVPPFETVRRRKNGSLVDISLTVSPIRTPSGEIVGASKIARDITEQKRLRAAIEQASRAKDEFLATLSHELRTPLNTVVGYTQMLQLGAVSEHDMAKALDAISRNAEALTQLVNDVLDTSRIVTGKMRLKIELCNIAAVAEEAVSVVRPAAEAKGISIGTDFGQRLDVYGDPDRLRQVLWNLLTNAVKFTPERGAITISGLADAGSVRITVLDTGIGIAPESLPYIFQRFWQADPTYTRAQEGLGLGLALVRHFVELHGGQVSVHSDGPGRGARFEVLLPEAGASARSMPTNVA